MSIFFLLPFRHFEKKTKPKKDIVATTLIDFCLEGLMINPLLIGPV